MYSIKDKVYENRWVKFGDYVVKFENQLANVPDEYIADFQANTDFEVLNHTEERVEVDASVKEEDNSKQATKDVAEKNE